MVENTLEGKEIRVTYGASSANIIVPVEATVDDIIDAARKQADLHISKEDLKSVMFDGKAGKGVTNSTEAVVFTPDTRTNG